MAGKGLGLIVRTTRLYTPLSSIIRARNYSSPATNGIYYLPPFFLLNKHQRLRNYCESKINRKKDETNNEM